MTQTQPPQVKKFVKRLFAGGAGHVTLKYNPDGRINIIALYAKDIKVYPKGGMGYTAPVRNEHYCFIPKGYQVREFRHTTKGKVTTMRLSPKPRKIYKYSVVTSMSSYEFPPDVDGNRKCPFCLLKFNYKIFWEHYAECNVKERYIQLSQSNPEPDVAWDHEKYPEWEAWHKEYMRQHRAYANALKVQARQEVGRPLVAGLNTYKSG